MRLVRWAAVGVGLATGLLGAPVLAADVGVVGGNSAELDVTETSIVAQHFDARDNESPTDSGWGTWINRLDSALRWGPWTAGLRLDSAVYWRRPVDNPDFNSLPAGTQSQVEIDGQSRFQNSIYPAKLWLTYSAPGLEITVGDAYVQFGRGLTLSMRKIDELAIDLPDQRRLRQPPADGFGQMENGAAIGDLLDASIRKFDVGHERLLGWFH